LETFEEIIEKSEKLVLRRPGPNGKVQGGEELAQIAGGNAEAFWSIAKGYGEPLMVRVRNGRGWQNYNIDIPEDEIETIAPPKAAQLSPPPAPDIQGGQFELFRLQLQMDKLQENKQAPVDINWLQNENRELRLQISQMQKDAIDRERQAYKKGKEDGEESGGGSEFGLRDVGPILEMINKKGPASTSVVKPPEPTEEPAPTNPGEKTGKGETVPASLKSLISLILTKAISPEEAPRVILQLFGRPALTEIATNRRAIFQEMTLDPEILRISNGETPGILDVLDRELEKCL